MTRTYWFGIITEGSDLEGEEFFVEVEGKKPEAIAYAQSLFPNETLECFGRVSEYEAECMGLDTY